MADQQQSPCRILVMASGNGSNFQALIDNVAAPEGRIPRSRIVRLVVNRAKAYATTRAERAGIPWEYFNLISNGFLAKGEKDEARVRDARERYDAALAEKVLGAPEGERPELVVLAGWMHVFGRTFLEPLEKVGIKVINLHPALPGQYDGAGAIERAFEDFKAGKITRTGIMVHYVVLKVDRGDPILVREIEFQEGDELAQVEERIHSHEHELIVEATAKVVREILEARGGK
ncbi:Bifunctional purine biosynthetic protein ADE5,7 [Diatrype stigma]|uniref:Phosphoribosylglycinamide formyltransferase n=1 Tax=Diatrype stigma TaxID=117547 RepID=A0AAN9UYL4_9PEZI